MLKVTYNNLTSQDSGCGCLIILFLLFLGYVLNFQNLWQYWPTGTSSTISVTEFLSILPFRWVVSLVGVFFFPLGIVTGYIW